MKESQAYAMSDLMSANRLLDRANAKARTEKVTVRGAPGKIVMARQKEIVEIAASMKDTHQEWVNKKFESLLPYLQEGKKTKDDVRENVQKQYNAGLSTAVTLLSKTSEKDDSEMKNFDSQDAVMAYTTRFINMLRTCQRFDISPTTALKLAKKSYNLDAPTLGHLLTEYRDISRNVVVRAADKNPIEPEKFLDKYLLTIQRLQLNPRYKNINMWVKEKAAESYSSDPESFLDTFMHTVAQLSLHPKYSHLKPSTIEYAVQGYPSNPEAHLDTIIARRKKQ